MTDNRASKHNETDNRETSEGLYHEAQADGVPYDEDLEPRSRELPKLTLPRD